MTPEASLGLAVAWSGAVISLFFIMILIRLFS